MVDVRMITLEVGCSKFVGRHTGYHLPLVPFARRTGGSGYREAYNYWYRNGDHKSWALLSLARFFLLLPRIGPGVSPLVENGYG